MDRRSTRTNRASDDSKEIYFRWLIDQVDRRHSGLETRTLLRFLFEKEFYPRVTGDENRVEDGLALRRKFGEEDEDYDEYARYLNSPCSVLEMLIALAQRIDFECAERRRKNQTARWFWEMVDNLGLKVFLNKDVTSRRILRENEVILEVFLNRNYTFNGEGGLFPLKKCKKDQRVIEIWYQLMAYLQERYPEVLL